MDDDIKIPDNLSLADLYVVLKKQERDIAPIVDIYKSWLTWRRGIAFLIGGILALMSFIQTVVWAYQTVLAHFK